MDSIAIIIGIGALVVGTLAGRFLFSKNTKKEVEDAQRKVADVEKQIAEAKSQAQSIIKEAQLKAETTKKEKELEAKEKFVQLKSEFEKDVNERNRKINEAENKVKQKELTINQKDALLEKQVKENDVIKENLNRQIEVVNQKRTELEKHQEEHIKRLEKVANLTAEDARNQLIDSLKAEAHSRALVMQQEIIETAKEKANKEARKIIIQSIQRIQLNAFSVRWSVPNEQNYMLTRYRILLFYKEAGSIEWPCKCFCFFFFFKF